MLYSGEKLALNFDDNWAKEKRQVFAVPLFFPDCAFYWLNKLGRYPSF